jgi:hypothetical protein
MPHRTAEKSPRPNLAVAVSIDHGSANVSSKCDVSFVGRLGTYGNQRMFVPPFLV